MEPGLTTAPVLGCCPAGHALVVSAVGDPDPGVENLARNLARDPGHLSVLVDVRGDYPPDSWEPLLPILAGQQRSLWLLPAHPARPARSDQAAGPGMPADAGPPAHPDQAGGPARPDRPGPPGAPAQLDHPGRLGPPGSSGDLPRAGDLGHPGGLGRPDRARQPGRPAPGADQVPPAASAGPPGWPLPSGAAARPGPAAPLSPLGVLGPGAPPPGPDYTAPLAPSAPLGPSGLAGWHGEITLSDRAERPAAPARPAPSEDRPPGTRRPASGSTVSSMVRLGRWLADRTGLTVLAQDGPALLAAGGRMFVPAGAGSGWLRLQAGEPERAGSRRFPEPGWDCAILTERTELSPGSEVEPLPAGAWLRPPGTDLELAEARRWLCGRLAGPDGQVIVVLGRPGVPAVPLGDIVRFWARLDREIRPSIRFVCYGPPPQAADSVPFGQVLADVLGEQVALSAGVPVSGWRAADEVEVRTLRENGSLGWRPFVSGLGYRPRLRGGDPPRRPAVLGHRPPAAGLREISDGVYGWADDIVLEVIQSGLWLRRPAEPAGAGAIRFRPAHPRYPVLLVDREAGGSDGPEQHAAAVLRALDPETRALCRLQPGLGGAASGGRHRLRTGTSAAGGGADGDHAPGPVGADPVGTDPVGTDPVGGAPTAGRPSAGGFSAELAGGPDARTPGARPADAAGVLQPGGPAAGSGRSALASGSMTVAGGAGQDRAGRPAAAPGVVRAAPGAPGPGPAAPADGGAASAGRVAELSAPEPASSGRAEVGTAPQAGAEPGPARAARRPPGPTSGRTVRPSLIQLESMPDAPAPELARLTEPAAGGGPIGRPAVPGPAGPDLAASPAHPARPDHAVPRLADPARLPGAAEPEAPRPAGDGPVTMAPVAPDAGSPVPGTQHAAVAGAPSPSPAAGPAGAPCPAPGPAGSRARAQPAPPPEASVLAPARGLDRERAWVRQTMSRQYGAAANSVLRVLSEMPGLRGTSGPPADLLTELVAARLYLHGQPQQVDDMVRAATIGPHVPFGRCVAAGLRRLPSYRGPARLRATLAEAEWQWYGHRDLVTEWGFCPALADGHTRLPGTVDFLIWSMTARRANLLEPSVQSQVIFLPGTNFKVLAVQAGEQREILLREVSAAEIGADGRLADGPRPLDQVALASLERASSQWREHPPGGELPERYAGRFASPPGLAVQARVSVQPVSGPGAG